LLIFTKLDCPGLTLVIRERGIRISSIESVGVLRRIHSENSWVTESAKAHQELRDELRNILAQKRANQPQL
jgi:hypothetical protein